MKVLITLWLIVVTIAAVALWLFADGITIQLLLGIIGLLMLIGIGGILWSVWNQAVYEGRVISLESVIQRSLVESAKQYENLHGLLNSRNDQIVKLTGIMEHQRGIDEEKARNLIIVAAAETATAILRSKEEAERAKALIAEAAKAAAALAKDK